MGLCQGETDSNGNWNQSRAVSLVLFLGAVREKLLRHWKGSTKIKERGARNGEKQHMPPQFGAVKHQIVHCLWCRVGEGEGIAKLTQTVK